MFGGFEGHIKNRSQKEPLLYKWKNERGITEPLKGRYHEKRRKV
jgi:hypothetical protein